MPDKFVTSVVTGNVTANVPIDAAAAKTLLALTATDIGPTQPRGPVNAISETFPRGISGVGVAIGLTSGLLRMTAIPLQAGQVVTTLGVMSGTTAAAGSTHCWFGLWTPARGLAGVTNDDTAAAPWASNTLKTLALATPYTVPTTGLYYLGCVVVASTTPSLTGITSTTQLNGLAPILSGTSDAALTDPASAPATAAALTTTATTVYGYAA